MSKEENKKRKVPSQDSENVVESVNEDLAPGSSSSMIAKKDFEIHHNEYHKIIKMGDDLSDVPAHYHANLKTEGVL